MALFGRKKDTEATVDQNVATTETNNAETALAQVGEQKAADILVRPRITEKSFALSQQNVYTFTVAPRANTYEIAKAVRNLYGVTPKKVNIVRKRPHEKRSLLRNRVSHQPGYKKAYVYLRDGDTINFM